MWLMDSVPELFGADDSDDLPECLQEDEQAELTDALCRCHDKKKMQEKITEFLENGADAT